MKIGLIYLFTICFATANSQSISKLVKEANNLYKSQKFEQSIKLCEFVLMSEKKDIDAQTNKASACWISSWIYKDSAFALRDIKKSYDFADKCYKIYLNIISEHPETEKVLRDLANSISKERNETYKVYSQINISVTNSTVAKDLIDTTKKSTETTVIQEKTIQKNIVNTPDTSMQKTDDKTVKLITSGQGKTHEEAVQSALRSAIEQAFGAFISSKTEILNDKILVDQFTSVSNGNIRSFKILNESQLPNGSWGLTIEAFVSLSKLTSFVEAKGITIEIKGGLFAFNIKQQSLNEIGEVKAVSEMVGMLHEILQISFDYSIKSDEPKSLDQENKNWAIPLVVTATTNKNIDFCADYCIKTLAALSLSSEEVESYKSLGKLIFPIDINYNFNIYTFYLRKQGSLMALNTLTSQWQFYTRLFTVKSGMDESNGNGEGQIHEFSIESEKYYNQIKSINFLTTGQKAGTFTWQDKRTLTQIEKMTGYNVKPRGVVSQFKHGGLVVNERGEHGLVVAITDLGSMDWKSAKTACDELILNGYSDWHLPTKDELNSLYVNLNQHGLGGFTHHEFYWSSTEAYSGSSAWVQIFSNGSQDASFGKTPTDYSFFVRAVRTF